MSVISSDLSSDALNQTALPADAPVQAAQDSLHKKAVEAAVKFEGFFVAEMLKQMRRTADELGGEDALFKDRSNRELLDMADQMTADALASQRAFGIADLLLRQILPEAAAAPGAKE